MPTPRGLITATEAVLDKITPLKLAKKCRAESRAIAAQALKAHGDLLERISSLGEQVGLTKCETEVLLFGVTIKLSRVLRSVCDAISVHSPPRAAEVLSTALELTPADIAAAMSSTGALFSCGLVEVEPYVHDLGDAFAIAKGFVAAFMSEKPLCDAVLSAAFSTPQKGNCSDKDFEHMRSSISIMRAALNQPNAPCHVLLAGPPGIGKTELALSVSAGMGVQTMFVRCGANDGEPSGREARFKDYVLGSRLLARRSKILIVFDEAEDVFTGDHWTHIGPSGERHKGWTNQLLESVKIPTIWISNSISRIDPAYLRRFSYVLEMKTPPRSVRRRLIDEAIGPATVSPHLLELIAESDAFTPADADRVARTLPAVLKDGMNPDEAVRELVACRPGGVRRERLAGKTEESMPYRLDWINVPTDLAELVERLKKSSGATLGLFGPPGTGKTALVRHLAQALDRPLHLKKASELLDPYVGGTEAKIAQAFVAAQEDGALLFLDEADSLLRDRNLARQSWEVTQVNELLAQLDAFSGFAALATNNADALDRALTRRVDVKMTFGFLKPEHAWEAFKSNCTLLRIECPGDDSDLAGRVRGMRELAFGDFSAVARGLRLSASEPTALGLLVALQQEVQLKDIRSKPIGF